MSLWFTTPPFVAFVLSKLSKGLQTGVGPGGDGRMCVQHVVSVALDEGRNDEPSCVDDAVRTIGIIMNDARWSSKKARGEGLKRFAIAQLGTAYTGSDGYRFNHVEFGKRVLTLVKNLAKKHGLSITIHSYHDDGHAVTLFCGAARTDAALTDLANGIAGILKKLKTPGSKQLCMLDWPKADIEALAKEHDPKRGDDGAS